MPNKNNIFINILGFSLILIFFISLQEFVALIFWLTFLFLGSYIDKRTFKDTPSNGKFILWYVIISILGLLICLDNYNNFGDFFGYAHDDKKFFTQYYYLFENILDKSTISSFIYLTSFLIYPIYLIKEISLLDIIPLNWAIIALTMVYLDKFCFLIIKKNIPLWIMIIGFCLRFVIVDTVPRFYRDNLLLLCLVIISILIYHKKYYKTIIPLVVVGSLRMANLAYPLLLFCLTKLKNVKKNTLIGLTICILFTITFFNNEIISFGVKYGSDISRTNIYISSFENYSVNELAEIRFGSLNKNNQNQIVNLAYSNNGLTSLIFKIATNYLFPLTLESPNGYENHYEKGPIHGFYFFKLIKDLCIICMIFTTGFLLLGIRELEFNL